MPYLLLALGLALAVYTLFRFLAHAQPHDVVRLALALAIVALTVALFYLAVTERLGAALGILAILWPMIIAWRNRRRTPTDDKPPIDIPPRDYNP